MGFGGHRFWHAPEVFPRTYAPCPCGFCGDILKPCTCAPAMVTKYQKRIPGPLLDHIGIHTEVLGVDYDELSGDGMDESSDVIQERFQAPCDIQQKRFSTNESSDIICNTDMRVGDIRQFCKLEDKGVVLSLSKHQSLMRAAS